MFWIRAGGEDQTAKYRPPPLRRSNDFRRQRTLILEQLENTEKQEEQNSNHA